MAAKLFPLLADQAAAVDPQAHIWLSASAGTGKTQVLSARVLRLLLTPGVRPENILCLTFTKAGAAEMAIRINATLTRWVQADDARLAADLANIGADVDAETLTCARTLFAAVLDAPGAGLRIQTIHSFCQSLLGGFPVEADIVPGFKPMEERDTVLLTRRVLGDMLLEARRAGDTTLLATVAALSIRLGEDDATKFLIRCAGAIELWSDKELGWDGDLLPHVNALCGLRAEADAGDAVLLCGDDLCDVAALRQLAGHNIAWGAATGLERGQKILDWLRLDPSARVDAIDDVLRAFLTAAGPSYVLTSGLTKIAPDYANQAAPAIAHLQSVQDTLRLTAFAQEYSAALTAGRAFAFAYRDAKRRAGVMDFDDLIRHTAALLEKADMSEWIRYKMDQQFDHVLIDEAQDTNARQWLIAKALAGEYFAGDGAKAGKLRTLFTVGDYKQAIYGFQGTSPENYTRARNDFALMAEGGDRALQNLSLSRNFRSSDQILALVDRMIGHLGGAALGLGAAPPAHVGEARPGQVVLWQVVETPVEDEEGEATGDDDDERDPWLSKSSRVLAQKIATQVRQWLDDGLWLDKLGRRATPGDIMILLRTRSDLASLIVAQLYARNVPVAGVDRLRLGQPLGIQDVLAAMKFTLQPLDDLNLANLLVSPLCGWTQDDLLAYAPRPHGESLWRHLRETVADSPLLDVPNALLRLADYGTPYQFLETILSGPIQGRAKLRARLGGDVIDPLNEFTNLALQFERDHLPSMQAFVHWFEASDTDIKREISQAAKEVRVMTVHGAKGLQAPVVIIADAASTVAAKASGFKWQLGNGHDLPVYALKKEERIGAIAAQYGAVQVAEAAEYWRLLYVAMTRAEEHLFIAGALGARAKEVKPESWYGQLQMVFDDAGCAPADTVIWGTAQTFGNWHGGLERAQTGKTQADAAPLLLPEWIDQSVAAEARPPRPLAPSKLGADDAVDAPALAGVAAAAARRGILLHRLFERLPEVPADQRADAAAQWLAGQAGVTDAPALVADALAVINAAQWADIFGPDALAEAPIAARVGDTVIAGTVDRLLITDTRITIVDFKTSRRPPRTLDAIAPAYLRQMAAYAAALSQIFPRHEIVAALLYTQTPQMFVLPPDLLAAHKPD